MALTLVTSDLILGLDYGKLTGTIPTWNQNTTGNADTATLAAGATILATARNINGVAFDGSADITIVDATKLPLAGGTLTGALSGTSAGFSGSVTATNLSGTNTGDETLSSINALAITSVGTIATGVWNGTAITDTYIASSAVREGTNNVAVGYLAMDNNINGYQNVAVGPSALAAATGINTATAVGNSASEYNTGNGNTAIGYYALRGPNTGTVNGNGNTAVGNGSLKNLTTSTNSTALGASSGQNITTGGNNTMIGASAGSAMTTNSNNTLIGVNAGFALNSTSAFNGNENTFIGKFAGSSVTTASKSVIIGSNNGSSIATLSNRIIISDGAGNIRQTFDDLGDATFNGSVKVGTSTTITPISGADDLVIDKNEQTSGISIISTIQGSVLFSDAADADVGGITYSHSGDILRLFSNATNVFEGAPTYVALGRQTYINSTATGTTPSLLINSTGNYTSIAFRQSNVTKWLIGNVTSISDSLEFYSGTTAKLTIASTGAATFSSSVTTGETSTLKATGNSFTNGSLILKNSDGTTNTYLTNAGGGFYLSNDGSTTALSIASTGAATFSGGVSGTQGNFSLGTVGGAIGSVKNLTVSNSNGAIGDWSGINFAYYNNTTNFAYIGSVLTSDAGNAKSDLVFGVKASTSATSVTEAMRITSGGNVGIGGTPSTFSNYTNVTIQGGSNGSNLDFKNSSGSRVSAIVTTASNELILETNTAQPMVFKTNDAEAMRINSGGNVGMGNPATGTAPLHVKYANGSYGAEVTSGIISNATSGRGTMRIRSDADAAAELFFDIDGAIRWDISVRTAGESHIMNWYPQAASPALNNVSSSVMSLTQAGDLGISGSLSVKGANYIEMATFTAATGSTSGIITNGNGYITSFTARHNSNPAVFSPVANGIKFLKAGLVHITSTQDFRSTGTTSYAYVKIVKNGVDIAESLRTNSDTEWDMLNSTVTTTVTVNDIIQFYYSGPFLSMDAGSWSQYSFMWSSS